MRSLFILILLLFCLQTSWAQDEERTCGKTSNKKALALLDAAKKETDWNKCKELVDEAIVEESSFPEAYLFLARRAKRKQDYTGAIEAYKKLIEICPDYSVDAYFDLGTYYFDKQQYDLAVPYLKDVKKFDKATADQVVYCDSLIRVSKLLKDPVPFDPKPLEGVSSEKDEYLPIITADNELCFFTRSYDKVRRGDLYATRVEEFTYSLLDSLSKRFSAGEAMSNPFNSSFNEGGASVTLDNSVLYFTICKPGSGYVNCDIYSCEKKNGRWGEIKNLGPEINSPKAWDSQPCISRDGHTLYFASDRVEANGSDIYMTTKNDSGKWNQPVVMDKTINTKYDEKSPFIHPDDQTLYFSSNGLPGLGGFDIFYTRKDSLGKWVSPKNIGYPINSEKQDLGFFVSTDGKTGYFASDKMKGKGGWDVYSFPLYEGARPGKVLFVKGTLKKSESDTAVIHASMEIKNTKTNEVSKVAVDSVSGSFVGVVNFKEDMVMTLKSEGYAFSSQYFSTKDSTTKEPVKVNVPLTKAELGAIIPINNIYYKTNSADLAEESVVVIREFAAYLKDNPRIKVEIRGHTDDVGDDQKNLALSADRAFTVYDLALSLGVPKTQISFKGYGETRPLVLNDSAENRAKNRRTEFAILGL